MQTRVYTYSRSGRRAHQPPRTIIFRAGDVWPPRCAWCRLQPLVILIDIVHEGVGVDLVESVGICSCSDLGTIVRREVPHGSLAYHYENHRPRVRADGSKVREG